MVAIRGGYRMARGWHYTKLSLSSALLSISGVCILFKGKYERVLLVFYFCQLTQWGIPWGFRNKMG